MKKKIVSRLMATGLLSVSISGSWGVTFDAVFESGSKWYGFGDSTSAAGMAVKRQEVQEFLDELGSVMASDANVTVYFTDNVVSGGGVAAEAGSFPINANLGNGEYMPYLATLAWRRINKGYTGHGVYSSAEGGGSLPFDADAYVDWNFSNNVVPTTMNLKFLLRHEILHALGAFSMLDLCQFEDKACNKGESGVNVSIHDLQLYYGDDKTPVVTNEVKKENGTATYSIANYGEDLYLKGKDEFDDANWIKVSSAEDLSHIGIMYDNTDTNLINENFISYLSAIGYEIKREPTLASSGETTSHQCAIKGNKELSCWGTNYYGEGNFTEGLYRSASDGSFHSCAISKDHNLLCWGSNTFGQLNIDSTESYKAVSAGNFDTCALTMDGVAKCWGQGAWVDNIPAGLAFNSIDLDSSHGCGILTDGRVQCWGFNGLGAANSPAGTYIDVEAGGGTSCAINADHQLSCWGGDVNSLVSQAPTTGSYFKVTIGRSHACALNADEQAVCWGSDYIAPPTDTFIDIAASARHTCGVKADGSVLCWGVDEGYGLLTPPEL